MTTASSISQSSLVDLGQHDVHGQIGGGQAARAGLPDLARGRRQRRLDHRHAGPVEHAAAVRQLGREGGGVDDDVGTKNVDLGGDQRQRLAILETGDVKRQHGEAGGGERVGQRRDGSDIAGVEMGAVEDDKRAAVAVRVRGRGVAAGRRLRPGRRQRQRAAEAVGDEGDGRADVVGTAGGEPGDEAVEIGGR